MSNQVLRRMSSMSRSSRLSFCCRGEDVESSSSSFIMIEPPTPRNSIIHFSPGPRTVKFAPTPLIEHGLGTSRRVLALEESRGEAILCRSRSTDIFQGWNEFEKTARETSPLPFDPSDNIFDQSLNTFSGVPPCSPNVTMEELKAESESDQGHFAAYLVREAIQHVNDGSASAGDPQGACSAESLRPLVLLRWTYQAVVRQAAKRAWETGRPARRAQRALEEEGRMVRAQVCQAKAEREVSREKRRLKRAAEEAERQTFEEPIDLSPRQLDRRARLRAKEVEFEQLQGKMAACAF